MLEFASEMKKGKQWSISLYFGKITDAELGSNWRARQDVLRTPGNYLGQAVPDNSRCDCS